jgi:zinc protease
MRKDSLLFGSLWLALVACGGASEPAKPPPPPALTTAAPLHGASSGTAAVDRTRLPSPNAAPSWALGKPDVFSLSNGMRVYFKKQGPTPLVSLLLVVPRGSATDPKGKAGLTALTADLLDEGAGGESALALSEELQRLGTDYSASVDVDNVELAMDTIAESFGSSVKLLADIVRKPAFDPKEFVRVKEHRIAEALAAESAPGSARAIVLRKALFGDGYGGQLSDGTRPTLKNLTLADARAQYRGVVAPEGAAFVVVGGIDPDPVKQALESAFGDWKGEAKAKSAPVSTARPTPGVHFVDFPGSTQSTMAIARPAPGRGTPEYFPALVMSRVFGESFTSRLNLNLREDKGYTYGAKSNFTRWKDAGYFVLSASVKRETTRASIDESEKELGDICGARPISAKERDEAVGGLLLGFPGNFERGGAVAAELATIPLYGRPDDWFGKWPSEVKAVTLGAANGIAKEYCDPARYVIVIAGDRKVVEPTLGGLGGKILFYDAKGNPKGAG